MRGFFEIGIYRPKIEVNYGTLLRSAYQLGASGAFVIGRKFKKQSSDTCGSHNHMPIREYMDFDEFLAARPYGSQLVAVESPDYGGRFLGQFTHPLRATYLLGSEDCGLPKKIVDNCDMVVSIESVRTHSYNVAVAGSLVMWDRMNKLKK